MDKLKKLAAGLEKLGADAEALYNAGEHHVLPTLRMLRTLAQNTNQRIHILTSNAAEKAAAAETAKTPPPTPPAIPSGNTDELRTDGPTLEEYVAAGYPAEQYPPAGYAPRTAATPPKDPPKRTAADTLGSLA